MGDLSLSYVEVNSSNWKGEVLDSKMPVAVEFYTPTCPYCRRLTPIFKDLSNEYSGKLKFALVDASIEVDLASGYGVMGAPTLKFLCSGRPIGEIVGLISKEELKKVFDEVLEKYEKCISQSSPLYA